MNFQDKSFCLVFRKHTKKKEKEKKKNGSIKKPESAFVFERKQICFDGFINYEKYS